MELADQEARALYSEPSVREYIRERVQVELLDTSEAVEAYCYNHLPLGLFDISPEELPLFLSRCPEDPYTLNNDSTFTQI